RFGSADIRFGSKADIRAAKSHVRFTLKSRRAPRRLTKLEPGRILPGSNCAGPVWNPGSGSMVSKNEEMETANDASGSIPSAGRPHTRIRPKARGRRLLG